MHNINIVLLLTCFYFSSSFSLCFISLFFWLPVLLVKPKIVIALWVPFPLSLSYLSGKLPTHHSMVYVLFLCLFFRSDLATLQHSKLEAYVTLIRWWSISKSYKCNLYEMFTRNLILLKPFIIKTFELGKRQ